ncbi:hypothetical protein [Streptomyces sp. NPDC002328]|uniref:hypothetical protein n=1 Tax=Streptomyces sp. NPDC002328 TaxID=3364642 RepID=UPI0036B63178
MARAKSDTSANSIWPPAEFLEAFNKLGEGDKALVLGLIEQQVAAREREDRRRAWLAVVLGLAFACLAFYLETRGDPYVSLGVVALAVILVWWLMNRSSRDASGGAPLALVRGISQPPQV